MIPLISYTIGILHWNKKEIQDLDTSTRKLLTMKGSFHRASDINRLYADRKRGGRGLQCIEDIYESRTIKLKEHLEQAAPSHNLLMMVKIHEQQRIMRLGDEFQQRIDRLQEHGTAAEKMKKEYERIWTEKVTHGYLQNKLNNNEFIDMKATNKWLDLRLTSHLEGYTVAIMEQEINTKETMKRKEKDLDKKCHMDTKCRICSRSDEESVFHLVCSCPILAPTLYLHVRHNQVARILYQEVLQNERLEFSPPEVTTKNQLEVWWDQEIKTTKKVKQNRPDMTIWNNEDMTCKIVEVTCPLDTNLQQAYELKQQKYIQLISQMQILYPKYKFSTVIIVVGGMGSIPKNFHENPRKPNIQEERLNTVQQRIQKAAIIGTIKICKTVMKM